MEAARFGFGLPPAYKFDPTDADLVAHYLLPRAIGFLNPDERAAIVDDDPCSCPPWELLRRHGHGGSDQGFFFGPPRDPAVNGGRPCRRVRPGPGGGAGGLWRGQKAKDADLVLVCRGGGGARLKLRYRRYNLTYYHDGDGNPSGWTMYEYHILHPKPSPGAVLWRIRITDNAKKQQQLATRAKQQQHAAADQQPVPGPEQPGPSNYPGGASTAREQASSGAQS